VDTYYRAAEKVICLCDYSLMIRAHPATPVLFGFCACVCECIFVVNEVCLLFSPPSWLIALSSSSSSSSSSSWLNEVSDPWSPPAPSEPYHNTHIHTHRNICMLAEHGFSHSSRCSHSLHTRN